MLPWKESDYPNHPRTHKQKTQQQITAISSAHTHFLSFLLSLSQEIKSPRSGVNELFIRVLRACVGVCALQYLRAYVFDFACASGQTQRAYVEEENGYLSSQS